MHGDSPLREDQNGGCIVKPRQGARHRFDGQIEMVRNVLTGHQQVDLLLSVAFRHFQKKTSDALVGSTSQQQAVVLRALQFDICNIQHMFRYPRTRVSKQNQPLPCNRHNAAGRGRFRKTAMLPKHFQAKIIARKIERENQPAAIPELNEGPDTAGLHFVNILGRLSFASSQNGEPPGAIADCGPGCRLGCNCAGRIRNTPRSYARRPWR